LSEVNCKGDTAMKNLALAAFLSLGLAAPAMAQGDSERMARLDIPTAADATLADCQVWLDQVSELVDEADPPVAEDVMSEAEQRRDQVAQACEAGNYHEGIVMAAETVEMIEAAAEN
jgi:hypothetical protein